jgi:hypothetical protein
MMLPDIGQVKPWYRLIIIPGGQKFVPSNLSLKTRDAPDTGTFFAGYPAGWISN